MAVTHYETFIGIVNELYAGASYTHSGHPVRLSPLMLRPYDLISVVEHPKDDYEQFLSGLSPSFKATARAELYRSQTGWIARGVSEGKIVSFVDGGSQRIAPIMDPHSTTGVDSSANVIVVCCFDNFTSGYRYLGDFLHLPKSVSNNEYHWNRLSRGNRRTLEENLQTLLNIACRKMLVIDTNMINSGNHFTMNQLIGMLEGCFTGFENDHVQNAEFRSALRSQFFSLIDGVPCHCDPDFQSIKPPELVRTLVRVLSKRNGVIQQCTPLYAPLRSHESPPIQLADLIAGAIRTNLDPREQLPFGLIGLHFDERYLSIENRRRDIHVKAYYWERKEV